MMESHEQGSVSVRVLEGRDLIACDKSGTSDPYCIVSLGSAKSKTKTIKKTLTPNWRDTDPEPFIFHVDHYSPTEILFEVYDWNKIYSHKRMGRAKVSLKDIINNTSNGEEYDRWIPLAPSKEKDEATGELRVLVQYTKGALPDNNNNNNTSNINNSNNNTNPLANSTSSSVGSFTSSNSSTGSSGGRRPTQASISRAGEEPELFTAIKNSELTKVESLIRDPKTDVNMKDEYGYTPLHAACVLFSDVDDQILTCLLQHKAINVNVENKDDNTPLHYFCAKFRSPNCTDAFEIFIEKGANVNAQNNNGETPLHKAIFNNSVRILMVNLLIKAGADVNKTNTMGETPLHYAVRLGREDLVAILLKAGADINVKGSKEGKTPYDLAIDMKHEKMAYLLKRAKDLFDWLDEIGMEKYKTVFIAEELYKDAVPDMDEKTLDKMGITTTGHRLKILKAAKALKPSNSDNNNNDSNKPEEPSSPTVSSPSSGSSSSASTAVTTTASSRSGDIEDELKRLKYINKSGTWILHNSELEFTVKLGSGASGTVYKGLYKGEEVAIKLLKTEQSAKELDEFKKEFQIMSTIQSPYIVFFFGACLEPKLCMVMELCSRGSLYHCMNDPKVEIGWDRVFNFSKEMVRGVDCLHSYTPQVLHRDFKSLNLMVNEQWHVKVGDFGLSRFNTDTQKETLGKMRGTFAYCAPEVYFGEKFSTKSDVFSIGIVLWEIVARCIKREYQRPFGEYPNLHFDFQIIIQTAKKGIRPTIPASCPEPFALLMRSCWEHESEKRPDCKEILEKLDSLEADYIEHPETWNATLDPPKAPTSQQPESGKK